MDHLAFCDSQLEWMLGELTALVRAESPTTDKAAVDRCGGLLEQRFAALGCSVERLRQSGSGDHLRVTSGRGERQVLLLGHFDTVWPVGQLDRMWRREGDRLFGPGVFDMKGGIVIAMAALRALSHAGALRQVRTVMLWTADEETGSRSSRALIEDEARRSEAVLVLEPALPDGAVKTSRKAVGEFELVVRGVLAHAGIDPGKGASAIHELARQVVRIEQLQDLSSGISVNVGLVSGGSRPNVIAGEARATIDVRAPRADDARRIEKAFAGLSPFDRRTSVSIAGGFERPPLERTPQVLRLYSMARDVAAAWGWSLGEGGTGGASDGNFTAALGVATLDGLGPEGDGAHAAHEHVIVSRLPRRAALLAGLIERIGTRGKIAE